MDHHELDDLFAAARGRGAVEPSAALLARVMDDAYTLQPAAAVVPAVPAPKRGLWAVLAGAFGGGAALAGIGTAAVAGVWLGFAQPVPLTALPGGLWSETPLDSVELIPSFDTLLTEG